MKTCRVKQLQKILYINSVSYRQRVKFSIKGKVLLDESSIPKSVFYKNKSKCFVYYLMQTEVRVSVVKN